jgi:acetyl-CoA synthetase
VRTPLGSSTGDDVWHPDPSASTVVSRFMERHDLTTFDELVRCSIDEPEWFWPAVVDHLELPFDQRWTQVLDTSAGVPFTTWFTGARLNVATACVDRWATTQPDATAVVWEGEDGDRRSWTYAELRAQADGIAAHLAAKGIGEGDAVGIYLPMLPETVAALLGVMKLGAVFLPIFSGYGAEAIALRLEDAGARALITADGTWRRGQRVDMLTTAEAAAAAVPTVETVVVVGRFGDGTWPGAAPSPFATRSVDAEHPLFIAYTSGTTGRPKGSVHVHGGFLVKVAEEVAFQFDCTGDDTLFWFTDMGWIMGPWEVIGGLATGATVALYEGAPDFPDPGRLWRVVERHEATILGISPTLVRALLPHGAAPVEGADLSRLRVLGSTGEPWNDGPWRWYSRVVGGGRCPIINISGGTEVGACFLSPHVVHDIPPMSLGGPSLGMAVDVFDDDGRPVRGSVGELVCTKPWPGMTRGLHKDPQRYLETYWSRYEGTWWHGDFASIDDATGQWYLHGRSDDTIKVAGKRLGPAEAESVLVSHPAVAEAAAVGLPDEVKGEALWCYAVLVPDAVGDEELRAELRALVGEKLGKAFTPSGVRFVSALPKTRNAKVLRRAIRAVAVGGATGDLSSLEDPSTLDAVRAAT